MTAHGHPPDDRAPGDHGLGGLHDAARRQGVPFAAEALPAEGFVDGSGVRLHYLDWGDPARPPVLLLHGFAQSGHSFDFVSLSLCDRLRVVALDLRGHGDSEWSPDAEYGRGAHTADVEAAIDGLGLAPVSIVGLSLGGTVGYLLASQRPDLVRSLVMVDIAPRVEPAGLRRVRGFVEGRDRFSSLEEMVESVRRFRPGRNERQLRGSVLRNARRLEDGSWSWKYDPAMRRPEARPRIGPAEEEALWTALERLACPALVVRGADSDIVSPASVAELVRRIPDARSTEVEGAGHLVPGDNPAGFIAAIEPFLLTTAQIGPGAPR